MPTFEFFYTFSKVFQMCFQWDNFQVLIIYHSKVSYTITSQYIVVVLQMLLYKVKYPITE